MSKLVWVLLPVLLAGAAAAWLLWRGRTPSRLGLNVASSLLLLAYVATTAGLGIFWVANQQLPVFDWHYLFGYVTVGLLALHLVFNFGVVWQTLTRRRHASAARPVAARRPALTALGLLGIAAFGAASYVLGLRHGRTTLSIAAGAESAGDGTALALIERFHQHSAHSRTAVLRRAPATGWGDAPPPFKRFDTSAIGARLALPPPTSPASSTPGVAMLGALLWHTAGVSERRGGLALRCSPSSGALFATELYVLAPSLPGLPAGLWHYDAQRHALQRLGDGAAPAATPPGGALASIVATTVFARSGHKYGDRTYRYVLADLGHALENLRVAAAAVGARIDLLPDFDGAAIAATLGVDEGDEGVLAVSVLRPPGTLVDGADAARPTTAASPTATIWPADAAGAQGLTAALHRATSLRTQAAPTVLRPAEPPAPAGPLQPLPRPPPLARDVLRVIATRRSRRRFAETPLPLPALAAVLAAMAEAPPQLSPAVRIDVLTPAVAGLPPAAWRYDAATHALALRERHDNELRRRARAAALDQEVIGSAAAVLVLSLSRADVAADAAGAARGYRHAFLEAGLVGERAYLEGCARGLGVCAVGAFYDDEMSNLAGIDPRHEWVVHLVALGLVD